jgi:hypothetical protein
VRASAAQSAAQSATSPVKLAKPVAPSLRTAQQQHSQQQHSPQQQQSQWPTVSQLVGNTPIVRLQHLPGNTSNVVLAKLEGHNPAGSAKDRPALHMLSEAERRGAIKRGDTIIEATSGNTGIALAMAAAIKGERGRVGGERLVVGVERRGTRACATGMGEKTKHTTHHNVLTKPRLQAQADPARELERGAQGHDGRVRRRGHPGRLDGGGARRVSGYGGQRPGPLPRPVQQRGQHGQPLCDDGCVFFLGVR